MDNVVCFISLFQRPDESGLQFADSSNRTHTGISEIPVSESPKTDQSSLPSPAPQPSSEPGLLPFPFPLPDTKNLISPFGSNDPTVPISSFKENSNLFVFNGPLYFSITGSSFEMKGRKVFKRKNEVPNPNDLASSPVDSDLPPELSKEHEVRDADVSRDVDRPQVEEGPPDLDLAPRTHQRGEEGLRDELHRADGPPADDRVDGELRDEWPDDRVPKSSNDPRKELAEYFRQRQRLLSL